MTITARLDLHRAFDVAASPADVYAVLADVPLSVSHFPRVERLTDRGGGVFEWQMERVGTEKLKIQTLYASRYVGAFDAATGRGHVEWTPVPGIGNAQIGGRWEITPRAGAVGGTHLGLTTRGNLEVPLPALMSRVVGPIVSSEFERLVARYVQSLKARFDQPPSRAST
jgi:carbon monoxide dehydrogenase subunit G